jgi:hypothetical protein
VLYWSGDVVNDLDPNAVRVGSLWGNRVLRTLSSDEVLAEFTLQDSSRLKAKIGGVPRSFIMGSLSVVSKSLLDRIRTETGRPVCLPVNPDFTMGCQLLNCLPSYLFFEGSMSFVHALPTSTGGNWHSNKKDVNKFWDAYGGCEIGYRHVPIKSIFIESQHFNDYVSATKLLGGRLARHPMNWTMYYVAMYEQNARNHRNGLDRTEELRAWKDALSHEPFALRMQVRQYLLRLKLNRGFKKIRTKSGMRRLEQLFKKKRVKADVVSDRKIGDIREFLKQETERLRKLDLRYLEVANLDHFIVDSTRLDYASSHKS